MSQDNHATATPIDSPPPAAMPVKETIGQDPRQALHRLARELMRAQNRKLLVEFLQLRRALR